MPATIAWVSDGEQGKPRRRRGRRRGRGAAASSEKQTNGQVNGDSTATKPRRSRGSRRGPERLRTVHETSAGGLVIDGSTDRATRRSPP